MSEFYFQAPTPEDRTATYKGMTFEQFRLLSDEEVAQLKLEERAEFLTAIETNEFLSEEWDGANTKLGTFSDFREWQRYGVPDRDMTYEEWDARVAHYVDIRRQTDPSYGTLTKDDIAHLNDEEWTVTSLALDENNPPDGSQPIVQVGGQIEHAMEYHGVTYEDLVAKGVLEPYEAEETIVFNSHMGYALAGKFGEYILGMSYPRETSVSVIG